MYASRFIVAAALLATALAAVPASAQCSGNITCSTTNTASVTVGALVKLEMSSSTTALSAPTVANLAAGFVANVGPTFTVHANQDWTMSIKAAASNPENWDYTGTKGGVKPIGDLQWAVASGGDYAPLAATDVTVAAGETSTDDTAVSLFFHTAYSSNYASANNRPGVYSLPVVFTLAAP
jgi:hypothetical protein